MLNGKTGNDTLVIDSDRSVTIKLSEAKVVDTGDGLEKIRGFENIVPVMVMMFCLVHGFGPSQDDKF